MTIVEYLQHVYVINGNVLDSDALCQCYISICVTHMSKATADKLHLREMYVAKKKFALVTFTALQQCHDLITVMQLNTQVYVVFHSEHKTQQVTDSFRQLQNLVIDHALEESVSEVVVDDSEVADDAYSDHRSTLQITSSYTKQTRVTIKSQLHLSHVFEEQLPEIQVSWSESEEPVDSEDVL